MEKHMHKSYSEVSAGCFAALSNGSCMQLPRVLSTLVRIPPPLNVYSFNIKIFVFLIQDPATQGCSLLPLYLSDHLARLFPKVVTLGLLETGGEVLAEQTAED